MRIFNGFDQLSLISNPVLTIGTFDGVHIGHQKIIQQLNNEAVKIGGESVLFTLFPHPRMVLFPDSHGLKLIQTQTEKMEKLKKNGLQNLIIQPFTKEFSNLSALEFVRDYLIKKLKIKKLVIGHDHQFGKNREGTIEFLRSISNQYNFEVIEISALEIDEVNVSSTKIRNAIETGRIEIANTYLGEPFKVSGIVVKGNQLGRMLGFPTANIQIDDNLKIIPYKGVYAVKVVIDDKIYRNGMMNIGNRPSIDNDLGLSLEVNIFDFNDNIYDSKVSLSIISRIRDEIKFDSIDALQLQLKKDEKEVRAIFNS